MMMKKIFAAAVCALCLVSCGQKKEAAPAEEQQPATEVAAEEKAPAVIKLAKGATIAKEAEKLVVIDFNATWCGPCRQFAPTFDKVAEEYADRAVFYSVDVDDHNDLAAQYNVQSIPMVVYLKPDGTYTSTVGLITESEFTAAIDAAL